MKQSIRTAPCYKNGKGFAWSRSQRVILLLIGSRYKRRQPLTFDSYFTQNSENLDLYQSRERRDVFPSTHGTLTLSHLLYINALTPAPGMLTGPNANGPGKDWELGGKHAFTAFTCYHEFRVDKRRYSLHFNLQSAVSLLLIQDITKLKVLSTGYIRHQSIDKC